MLPISHSGGGSKTNGMALSIRNRTRLRTAIGVGLVGIVVAIAYDATVAAALDYRYTFVYFLSSVYLGATIGFGLAAFELFYVEGRDGAWLRRAPPGVSLAVTVTCYTAIFLVFQLSSWFVFGGYPYLSRGEFALGRVGLGEIARVGCGELANRIDRGCSFRCLK